MKKIQVLVGKNKYVFLLVGILILHLFLLTQTVFWASVELRLYSYLTSKGFIPYKDIIDHHFPGLFFLPINFYNLGLATPQGFRFVQFALVITTQLLIFASIKKIHGSSWVALCANILYMCFQITFEGYIVWIDTFIPPLILGSWYCLNLGQKSKAHTKFLTAGVLLAGAMLFKQLVGVVVITTTLWLIWRRVSKTKIVLFLLGCVMPLLLVLGYFYTLHNLHEFFYWTGKFNSTIYAQHSFRDPTVKEVIMYSLVILPSLLSLGYLYTVKKVSFHASMLAVYIVPLLLFIYGRYDFVHIQPFLPFAAITIVIAVASLRSHTRLVMVGILAVYILMGYFHVSKLGKYDAFMEPENNDIINEVIALKNQNHTIYVHNIYHEIYQLSETVPANGLFSLTLPWYMMVEEKPLLASIEKSKPDIIVRQYPAEQERSSIDSYIDENYLRIKVIRNVEILQRAQNNHNKIIQDSL